MRFCLVFALAFGGGACGSDIRSPLPPEEDVLERGEILDADVTLAEVSTPATEDTDAGLEVDEEGEGHDAVGADALGAQDAGDGQVEADLPLLPQGEGKVVLNEMLAANAEGLTDSDGDTSDWIELHNPGEGPMHLDGWGLSDRPDAPQLWVFPDVSIPPGGYLIVFASSKDRRDPASELHTNFKLTSQGEFLGLSNPGGDLVQSFGDPYPLQLSDVSYGTHVWDGLYYLDPPTPGEANYISTAATGLGDVNFEPEGGLFSAPFELTLKAPPKHVMHVTLDGTQPSASSPLYQESIPITKTTQVRVALVDEEGGVRLASSSYVLADPAVLEFTSDIPVIVLESAGFDVDAEAGLDERPYRPLSIAVFEDAANGLGGSAAWSGLGAMHVRGNSSANYAKKQYALELRDAEDEDLDVPLLGMPPESDWVLHAPYSDKSLMRNAMIYQWSNAIGRYAARTRFVEVFIAPHASSVSVDDYRGVYVVMEKLKRGPERVDIAKLEPEHIYEPEISGGYLLKKDWWAEGFDTVIYQDHLIWVDPDADRLVDEQKTWIGGFFNAFEAALAGPDFQSPWLGYAAFIDVDSFIDHHLLVEFARNVDGFVLSTYLHKDRDGRLNMGPIWDYNGALGGADYFCSWLTEGWHHTFNEAQCGGGGASFPADNPHAYRWYERLFEDPAFAARYAERWHEHRSGALSTPQLHADIDAAADALAQAQARNFARWPVLGQYVWPNAPGWDQRLTFEQEVAYLKTWLEERAAWMDSVLSLTP